MANKLITTIKIGVKIFPMRSTNLVGFKANKIVIIKNTILKTINGHDSVKSASGKKGATPISNDTVAVRGIAKSGPITR